MFIGWFTESMSFDAAPRVDTDGLSGTSTRHLRPILVGAPDPATANTKARWQRIDVDDTANPC
jgi:hypothetical protein